jgi:phosphate transport system permease protein
MMNDQNLSRRQSIAKIGRLGLLLSFVLALSALVVLFGTILDKTAGYTVTRFAVDPKSVSSKELPELNEVELVRILQDQLSTGAFDNLLVEELDKQDPASRTNLIEAALRSPAESTVSDVPLDQLSTLEITQEIIETRLGSERIDSLLEQQLSAAEPEVLAAFIREQFLSPVTESDLTNGRTLDALELDELLTIINERFTDAQLSKYDVSELANDEQSRVVDVIRAELVGQADEASILGKPLAEGTREELADYLRSRLTEETFRAQKGMFVSEVSTPEELINIVRAELLQPIDPAVFSPNKPIAQLSSTEIATLARANLDDDRRAQVYAAALGQLGRESLRQRVENDVLLPSVARSWGLFESLLNRRGVEAAAAQAYPGVPVEWRNWVRPELLSMSMSSRAEFSGIRTALFGSLWLLLLTILIALPLGVGAAIYLEEFAGNSRLSNLIQLNIYNLAGIPSIIYGMLGLTVFVRALGDIAGITSGAAFGLGDGSGRTILSAALTMALLILPLIIVNAQEALRAVPSTLREAAYGIGLTKLQTLWHHVLPSALPGILTGTILAMSRAIGETAPLIVVGASTFIALDPNGPFSRFTVLPIQIYKWTTLPDATFLNVSAAAIIVLLIMLVSLNLTAILLRNRFRKQL